MNTYEHYPNGRPTRDEALDRAAQTLVTMRATALTRTPREQAEAAWHVGSPYTVDELEDLIRGHRGLPLINGNDLEELELKNPYSRASRERGGETR